MSGPIYYRDGNLDWNFCDERPPIPARNSAKRSTFEEVGAFKIKASPMFVFIGAVLSAALSVALIVSPYFMLKRWNWSALLTIGLGGIAIASGTLIGAYSAFLFVVFFGCQLWNPNAHIACV